MRDIINPPKASSLIESLRDIGYSFKTAIADIIDNSISASADLIEIVFNANSEHSNIAILDNGVGLSFDEMIEAMRPGSINPLEERSSKDLGRFGLGLKTASFSQCRKLTIVSRKDNVAVGCCWDLDYISAVNEWLLQVLEEQEINNLPYFDKLKEDGTLILWETLDRLNDKTVTANFEAVFYEKIDEVRKHLQLVFHRYLKGESGIKSIGISINGDPLLAFDPFNSKHPATQHLQDEKLNISGQPIHIQPYILPHHSKINRKEYEYYAGDEGYLKNQGFYVYRNSRLIISGTWFRLAAQRELTKLARVKIDLPNSLDYLWSIDVKKSRARPPETIRQRLKRVIERITNSSTRVYTQRGRRLTREGLNTVWTRNAAHNSIFYTINRDHPFLETFLCGLDEDQSDNFSDILKMIESQFPTDTFYSDVSGSPESLEKNEFEDEKLLHLAEIFRESMKSKGITFDEMKRQFQTTEPFMRRIDLISEFLEKEEKNR